MVRRRRYPMAVFVEVSAVEKHSRSLVVWGVLNILLGLGALLFVGFTTLVSVAALGLLFIVEGVAQIAFGIWVRGSGSVLFHVVLGLVAIALGVMVFRHPVANAAGLTLFVGSLCLVLGLGRALAAVLDGFRDNAPLFLSGVVSALIGTLILLNWPASAVWTIGVFVGVEILTFGIVLVRLGMGRHRLVSAVERVVSNP
jgi:uncharacterized membrane protein HdeD (DUF308 family)